MIAPALVLRSEQGTVVAGDTWTDEADAVDRAVLLRCRAPVLDIGCGPARHVLALAERGIPALGIDLTPYVVEWARRRGAAVLERCVFDRVPGCGRWRTALLLDGNVGIGADPANLLRRVTELVAPDGVVLVEVDCAPRPLGTTRARLELQGRAGPWFAWTGVDADALIEHADAAGLATSDRWAVGERCFVELRRATVAVGV
jgi:SAM-dependent methyltransferase